ncbi:MAG TPA: hypothetical protein VLJ68_13560 [Chitinophagaceae bacterium]|nr:hypothetical protein [Chitinophagaceae bacterium]
MKKLLIGMVLLGGLTGIAFASLTTTRKKSNIEKKSEKKEKKECCRHSCPYSI